jgi:hypothetical protein
VGRDLRQQEPMNDDRQSEVGSSSLGLLLVWLTLPLLVVYPAFAWYGYSRVGVDGILAAALAGVICWVGAAGALAVASLFRQSQQAASALMLGMLFRMGLPLAAVAWLMTQGGWLAEAGVVGMILIYYLVSLIVETVLSLRLVGSPRQATKAS